MPKVRMPDGSLVDVGTDALFADDGSTPFVPVQTPPLQPGEKFFTEADVARIRQEEKDKLYGEISRNNQELAALREQVGTLTSAQQAEQQRLEQEQQRLEAERRAQEEKELDAKTLVERRTEEWRQQLDQVNQTWSQRFEESEQQRLAAEALAAKEREFSELRDYTQQQIAAHQNEIAPQLLPFVTGNSREEIDASIARVIASTNDIAAEMQQITTPVVPPEQQVVIPQQQQVILPGTRPTGVPGNTDPAAQMQTLTQDQINNMSMSEYAKLRQQMGIGGQSNNRGLFG